MTEAWKDTSRHNGRINGARIKARGFSGIIARCTIGIAPRDVQYLNSKLESERNGLGFGAYGVNWPINRNPKAEAQHFAANVTDPASPNLPLFVVGDFELGTREHPSGHHEISGKELVEQAVIYCETLEFELGLPVLFYTAKWHWNDPKMLPYIDAGEKRFPLLTANYPYDRRQYPGLPPRYSPDVLSPYEYGSADPLVPKPWDPEIYPGGDLAGFQWTSKGRGEVDGYAESRFLDRDEIYVSFIDPDPPPPPSPYPEQIRKIAEGLITDAADLNKIADELEG
jgi:hypothetical protein